MNQPQFTLTRMERRIFEGLGQRDFAGTASVEL